MELIELIIDLITPRKKILALHYLFKILCSINIFVR